MGWRSGAEQYRHIGRGLAVLLLLSVSLDVALVARALILHQNPSQLQSLLGSAAVLAGLVSLGLREALPKKRDIKTFRQLAIELQRSRLKLLREERSAALLNRRYLPIDIKLSPLKASKVLPPAEIMSFRSIRDLFAAVPDGRMAIVGRPGAGKTLIAMELACQISAELDEDNPQVPVIFTPQEWDPQTPSIDYWVCRQIVNLLGVERDVARSLLDENVVVPIFDGLDEIDISTSAPINAGLFIDVLNKWDRRFVVTCRTETWDCLEAAGRTLEDACIVEIEPVTRDQAIEYLTERNKSRSSLEPLLLHIAGGSTDALRSALASPIDLMLIGSLLADGDSTKKLMLDGSNESGKDTRLAFESGLLFAFIRARVEWYPRRFKIDGRKYRMLRYRSLRRYSVSHVLRWSHSLARFLADTGGREFLGVRMPTTSIAVERLWPLGGMRAPRIVDRVLTVGFWAPFLVLLGIELEKSGASRRSIFAIICALSVLPISSMWVNRAWVNPSIIVFRRLLQRRRLLRLALGGSVAIVIVAIGLPEIPLAFSLYYGAGFILVFGLGLATSVRDSINLPAALATGLIVGIGVELIAAALLPTANSSLGLAAGIPGAAVSMVIAVQVGIWAALARGGGGMDIYPAGLPTPLGRLQGDLRTGLTAAIITAGAAIVIGLTGHWLSVPVWAVLILGLSAGLAAGLGTVAATWRRYLALLICTRGRLPWRLASFLRWAHAAGLLRTAGRSYEFRHRRLLDWLTDDSFSLETAVLPDIRSRGVSSGS
jgi:hypothetical protein